MVTGSLELGEVPRIAAVPAGNPGPEGPDKRAAAESVRGSLAPPDRMLNKDQAGLDDRELLDIGRLSPRASKRRAAACELLVIRHQGPVRSRVRRYPGAALSRRRA